MVRASPESIDISSKAELVLRPKESDVQARLLLHETPATEAGASKDDVKEHAVILSPLE